MFRRVMAFSTFFVIAFISLNARATFVSDSIPKNSLTIYTIAPPAKINWHSPRSLYVSVKRSYTKKLFQPQSRFLGHMVFKLESPLLNKPLYAGIAPTNVKQMTELLFKNKIGLGLLGYPFNGGMESEEVILKTLDYNFKKNRVAYITYNITEEGAKRIIQFLDYFTKHNENGIAPDHFYGGAFWPLFKNEGSGCSALCMSALKLAGAYDKQMDDWLITQRIPIELIGGAYTNKKISFRKIKKTRHWYSGNDGTAYVNFEIYDPQKVFLWIRQQLKKTQVSSKNTRSIGLYVNATDTNPLAETPLIEERKNPSLFIHHFQKMQANSAAN